MSHKLAGGSPHHDLFEEWDDRRGRSPSRQSSRDRSHSAEGRARLPSPDIRRVQSHQSPLPLQTRAAPPPRQSPFQYNLPPSEPIYHDIEQERMRRTRSFSPSRSASDYEKRAGFVYPSQSDLPRISEQVQTQARLEPKAKDESAMIMFSDAFGESGSVLTGWSEQELLQKQKKVEKRRDKSKYGKKKKKERILNMPPSLKRIAESPSSQHAVEASPSRNRGRYIKSGDDFPPSTGQNEDQAFDGKTTRRRGLMSRIQKRTVPLAPAQEGKREKSRWNLMRSRSSEEQDSTHSSHGSSGVPEVDNDVLYASLPINTAEPNDTRHAMQQQAEHEWRKSQEEDDEEEEAPLAPGAFPVRPSDLSGRVRSKPVERPRAGAQVRFGDDIEHFYSQDEMGFTTSFDMDGWVIDPLGIDEDHESPVSIMAAGTIGEMAIPNRGSDTASTGRKHKTYPKSKYPKSILRNGRASTFTGTEVLYDGVSLRDREEGARWDSPSAGAVKSREISPAMSPQRGLSPRDVQLESLSPDRFEPSNEGKERHIEQIYEDDDIYSDAVDFIDAVASVVIQTAIRRHLAKIAVEKRRAECMAGESVQHFENMAVHMFDLAAIQIQSTFRGWWVRDCLSVDRLCATRIQKAFRGYACRMAYLYSLYRIILLQSLWRCRAASRIVGERLSNVIAIQALYRGYIARRARAGLSEDEAAVVIQSTWRMYDAQMYYLSDLAAVLIAQSVFRRWVVNRRVLPYMYARPIGSSDCLILDEHSRSRDEKEKPSMYHARVRGSPSPSAPFDETKKTMAAGEHIQTEASVESAQVDRVHTNNEMITADMVHARQEREKGKGKMSIQAANFWKKKEATSKAPALVPNSARGTKVSKESSHPVTLLDNASSDTLGDPLSPLNALADRPALVSGGGDSQQDQLSGSTPVELPPAPSASPHKDLANEVFGQTNLAKSGDVKVLLDPEKETSKMSTNASSFWNNMARKKQPADEPVVFGKASHTSTIANLQSENIRQPSAAHLIVPTEPSETPEPDGQHVSVSEATGQTADNSSSKESMSAGKVEHRGGGNTSSEAAKFWKNMAKKKASSHPSSSMRGKIPSSENKPEVVRAKEWSERETTSAAHNERAVSDANDGIGTSLAEEGDHHGDTPRTRKSGMIKALMTGPTSTEASAITIPAKGQALDEIQSFRRTMSFNEKPAQSPEIVSAEMPAFRRSTDSQLNDVFREGVDNSGADLTGAQSSTRPIHFNEERNAYSSVLSEAGSGRDEDENTATRGQTHDDGERRPEDIIPVAVGASNAYSIPSQHSKPTGSATVPVVECEASTPQEGHSTEQTTDRAVGSTENEDKANSELSSIGKPIESTSTPPAEKLLPQSKDRRNTDMMSKLMAIKAMQESD